MRLFVPGRICLFGEHSDWAGEYRREHPAIGPGCALIAGTEQGLHAEVAPLPDELILTSSALHPGHRPHRIPMDLEALRCEAQGGGFWSYVAGVAHGMRARYPVGGLRLDNNASDLPVRKGLSSSAAICVLTARAFNRLYGLGLDVRGEMELAYQGELLTGSRCGRMDQACAFGTRPVLLDFDGDRMEAAEVAAGGAVHLLVVDLEAGKDTRLILERLHAAYPATPDAISRGVRELLGPINRRIVTAATDALTRGDAPRLGGLMTEAQEAFDRLAAPACPEELTAPVLHRVLSHPALQAHVWGGKGVGSQGDGTAQFVARSRDDREAAIAVIERDLGMSCLRLTIGG